jgi:death on curing protein
MTLEHAHTQTASDLLARVYEIHDQIMARTGGQEGVRDSIMLRDAVIRPFAAFAGKNLYPDEFEKAAALFHALIKYQPFVDGNKRTAFVAALYFLQNRGHTLPYKLPREEVIRFCMEVADDHARRAQGLPTQPKTVAAIADWFRWLLAV